MVVGERCRPERLRSAAGAEPSARRPDRRGPQPQTGPFQEPRARGGAPGGRAAGEAPQGLAPRQARGPRRGGPAARRGEPRARTGPGRARTAPGPAGVLAAAAAGILAAARPRPHCTGPGQLMASAARAWQRSAAQPAHPQSVAAFTWLPAAGQQVSEPARAERPAGAPAGGSARSPATAPAGGRGAARRDAERRARPAVARAERTRPGCRPAAARTATRRMAFHRQPAARRRPLRCGPEPVAELGSARPGRRQTDWKRGGSAERRVFAGAVTRSSTLDEPGSDRRRSVRAATRWRIPRSPRCCYRPSGVAERALADADGHPTHSPGRTSHRRGRCADERRAAGFAQRTGVGRRTTHHGHCRADCCRHPRWSTDRPGPRHAAQHAPAHNTWHTTRTKRGFNRKRSTERHRQRRTERLGSRDAARRTPADNPRRPTRTR